jgi:hypothetical protein
MKYLLRLMAVIFPAVLWAQLGVCDVIIAPKQLVIVKPGLDQLNGTWVAAVINRSQTNETFRVPVLLPKEAIDFRPVEGVDDKELRLEADGVFVEKSFSPGVNVISFAFLAPASRGALDLNFNVKSDLGELSVMTPKGLLSVHGQNLILAGSDIQDFQTFSIWVSKSPLRAGDEIKVSVEGIPEGRQRLWSLGAVFGLLLAGGAGFLTWRSNRASHLKDNSGNVVDAS